MSSKLSMGDCSAAADFDVEAQVNLQMSIAASLGIDDWESIEIKNASCGEADVGDGARRRLRSAQFTIDFDISVPSTDASAEVDESTIESDGFLQNLATEFNNMQEASGRNVTLNASDLAASAVQSSGTTASITVESGRRANSSILLTMTREPDADVTVTITSSDETEATVEPEMVIFTPRSNFSLVNVLGQNDDDVDGDLAETLSTHERYLRIRITAPPRSQPPSIQRK